MKWINSIIALSLAGTLSACGFFGSEPEPPPPPAVPVELSYVTSRVFGNVEEVLVEAFEAEHPHIKLKLIQSRQGALNYLNEATPPDLMLLPPSEQLGAAIEQGLITEISELWAEMGGADAYPAAFRPLSERDGKQFFMPLAYAWNGVYYNKSVFAQYNLQPPTTWDELMQICETLLLNGEVPFVISGNDRFMASLWLDYLNLRLNGAEFHRQLSAGEISYVDDMRVRTVFEQWRRMIEQGYVLSESATMGDLNSFIALVRNEKLEGNNRKAVMALSGPVFLNEFPEPLRVELDFFPFPTLDASIPSAEPVYVVGFVVPAAAPHRQEALQFLTFLNSEKGRAILQKDITVSHLYIPAFADAETDELPATIQQGMSLVQDASDLTSPYAVNVPRSMFGDTLLRELLSDPQRTRPFDLDAELQKLEEARQAGR